MYLRSYITWRCTTNNSTNVFVTINKLAVLNLFSEFSAQISNNDRIGIIGRNGSGKTTLLNLINSKAPEVNIPKSLKIGFVPQSIDEFDNISGSEKFNKKLSLVLSSSPDILILDEPTNHLDTQNRRSLMRMVNKFKGAVIAVSHDVEFLRTCTNTLWHIENGAVKIFKGDYDNYIYYNEKEAESLQNNVKDLKKEERAIKIAKQNEIKRTAQSKRANVKENDKNLLTLLKESGSKTHGSKSKKLKIAANKNEAAKKDIFIYKEIIPSFQFKTTINSLKPLITINGGVCSYGDREVVKDISFNLNAKERVAILGNNGSGKSTFMKALTGDESASLAGDWLLPKEFGYLDQHYANLDNDLTVFETIRNLSSHETDKEIRKFLNDYLFRKNEEVEKSVKYLSLGEKLRLSLAIIGISTPNLLLVDEITNNIDIETRNHIVNTLNEYQGAIIVISHDSDFLSLINITKNYIIEDGLFAPFNS